MSKLGVVLSVSLAILLIASTMARAQEKTQVSAGQNSGGEAIAIVYDPVVFDPLEPPHLHLCPGVPNSPGSMRDNDHRKTLAEFLGSPAKTVRVHYYSDDWKDFDHVRLRLKKILDTKPKTFYRYEAWAEPTMLSNGGIIATIAYSNGKEGHLEIASRTHLCAQDQAGTYWWVRLEAIDIYP